MTGATPIYFMPARNDYGIIGPIGLDQFSPEAIRKKIAASPIARGHKAQGAHRGGHQLHLRRPLLQRREDQGARWPTRSTRCTSTRPGTPMPRSTSSTPAATRWACRAAMRAPSTAGVRHAVDAQAAGRVLAGLDDPRPGHREQAQDRHDALQRRLHDARLDLAALRHHRLARRELGDDGRPGGPLASCRRRTTRRCSFRARAGRPAARTSSATTGGSRSGSRDGLDLDTAPTDRRLGARARSAEWHGFGNAGRRLHDARPDQGHAAHAGPGQGRDSSTRAAFRPRWSPSTCGSAAWWWRRPGCTAS